MTDIDHSSKNVGSQVNCSFIKILTDSTLSRRQIPFMSVISDEPGPVVWLTACAHGDEVGGMVIIHEVCRRICGKKLLRGALYAFPLMNPIGFEMATRNVSLSNEDLNRSYPGNKKGSLAERIAHIIFSTIKKTNPTIVLDLHNDWMKSVPYTILDPNPDNVYLETYDKAKIFSETTGFIVILDTADYRKSLSFSLIQHNIPALTLELGGSLTVDEENVGYGIKSILNILVKLEMIEPVDKQFHHRLSQVFKQKTLSYSQKPVSSNSGIIRFMTKPGDKVKKGQQVAKIYNSFGHLEETVTAEHTGIVLGHSDQAVAYPGAPVMAFGHIGD